LIPFLVVVYIVYLGRSGARRRARQASAEARAAGGGIWLGSIDGDTVDWLWDDLPPYAAAMVADNLPVHLAATGDGLLVWVRGMSRLLIRRPPRLIPWSDIAGARELDPRHTDHSSRISLVTLTPVIIDVVGTSAAGWLGFDNSGDGPRDDSDDDSDGGVLAELAGDGWQPGSAPLRFLTAAPDGLVEMVLRRRTGRITLQSEED
jgi:hypothetical protein